MNKPNRRQFVISTAAAAATVAGTALTAISGPGRACLVGLGGAGCALLDFILPRLPIGFDRHVHGIATTHVAGLFARSFLGLDVPPLRPTDPIVLLVGLGGRVGATAPLLASPRLRLTRPFVVASLPFAFEGKRRRTRAERVAGVMERAGVKLVVVDLQTVLQEQGSPDAGFRRVENVALDTVLRVGRGLPAPSVPRWNPHVYSDRRDIPLPDF